jgi:hypothetical protein
MAVPLAGKGEESPLKSVPSLLNFFVYNSTFGPREGEVKIESVFLSVCLCLSMYSHTLDLKMNPIMQTFLVMDGAFS